MEHSMRKLLVSLIVLFSLIAGVLLWPSNDSTVLVPPSVVFAGREFGPTYKSARFKITNSLSKSIFVREVQVQIATNGGWETVSKARMEASTSLDPGDPQPGYSPAIESGGHRRIVVAWPEEKPWRIQIIYSLERRGLAGLALRSQMAWQRRRLPSWSGRVWSGTNQVVSEAVAK